MHRFWLTILMALALATGGFANAQMAFACPMQTTTVAVHDCCPDGSTHKQSPSDDGSKKMSGCFVGQACRSAPAVAPTMAPLRVSAIGIRMTRPLLDYSAPASGPLQELFRPPRSI
jgi:hypothetical protein